MQNSLRRTVVLGTGGTIAGTAQDARDNVGYQAAQLGVAQLLAGVAASGRVETEQVA
jgi:L-asparaginase